MGGWLLCEGCGRYSHTHNGGGLFNNHHYCELCYTEHIEEELCSQ
jgi:hypothetical protein